MKRTVRRITIGVVAVLLMSSAMASADVDSTSSNRAVRALFNLHHPETGPFPTDIFTVADHTHNTGRRVNLPYPDCTICVSDCEDLDVINELDGFNLQPRLSVPFSGPIDVNTATSETIFLISLGSTLPGQGYMPRGTVVGINQIVWDVETNTLHVESDELLAQHTRFALIVTNRVGDAEGDRVEASREFRNFRETAPPAYRRELEDAIQTARRLGISERQMVTASVFTTLSATAVMEEIRDQIKAGTPEPADFLLGPNGERTVFPFEEDGTNIVFQQHTGNNPPSFTQANLSLAALRVVPGAVGQLAFGKFLSPDYMVHPGEYIPAVGTRTGMPAVQGSNEIYFNLILPSGEKPQGGWPVQILGHGGGGSKQIFSTGAVLASQGIATITINAAGHGFGPLGSLTVNQAAGKPMTFLAGGRGIDQNGNDVFANDEGFTSARPRSVVSSGDGIRQTVADLMQLVRVIEVGVDVDGDGSPDLDPSRIYYHGISLGGNYGTVLLAVDPSVQAGVLNVPGGPSIENGRLSPDNRPSLGRLLNARSPSLINPPGLTSIGGIPVGAPHFDENLPLRNQPPVVNTMAGAMAIQEALDRIVWASQSGSPVAFAPHVRRAPLPGVPAQSVIYLFAKGDRTVPNPNTTAILRAGALAEQTSYYRNDLAFAEDPAVPRNPHMFTSIGANPLVAAIARGAQDQIAAFFASDGKEVIHPEPKRFFEVPLQGPLPEELNFIP